MGAGPVVWVLGAGASHGDRLERIDSFARSPHNPPTALSFFDACKLEGIDYGRAFLEEDFPNAFRFVRGVCGIGSDQLGTGAWTRVDIEQIFTFLELEREFLPRESSRSAELIIARNELTAYVHKLLALCTDNARGAFYQAMSNQLGVDDSVITFNWDLLADEPLLHKPQYENFSVLCLGQSLSRNNTSMVVAGTRGRCGLYLKLHGSLNWYMCTNERCPNRAGEIAVDLSVQLSLNRHLGIGLSRCQACGSESMPVIVPPILHKQVSTTPIIRAAWGLAHNRLLTAAKVFVVGFSLPPTDYYAHWLLRTCVGMRAGVEVHVVNPCNSDPQFQAKMNAVFPKYQKDYSTVEELTAALPHLLG